jgi:hypothetical protein
VWSARSAEQKTTFPFPLHLIEDFVESLRVILAAESEQLATNARRAATRS